MDRHRKMRPETSTSHEQRIQRVLRRIEENLDAPHSLDELAACAHFSPFHFHRIFRGLVGEALMEYIRRLRLQRAAHRLRFSSRSVTEVALEAGYDSLEAFSRAFRGVFELAPSRYRKRSAEAAALDPEGSRTGPTALARPERLDLRVQQLPRRSLAYLRHQGPYHEVGSTWRQVMQFGMQRGFLLPIGICHDDPEVTPAERIRYDACVQVSDSFEVEPPFHSRVIDAGEFLIGRFVGPYEQLSPVYAYLCGPHAAQLRREVEDEPSLEIYHNSPETTPPDQLITEILLRLSPVRSAG